MPHKWLFETWWFEVQRIGREKRVPYLFDDPESYLGYWEDGYEPGACVDETIDYAAEYAR